MFCRNCGKQIDDNAKFCEFCGHKLTLDDENTSQSYYKKSYKKTPDKKTNNFSFGKSFSLGMLIMALLGFALVGAVVLKNAFSGDVFTFDKLKYEQYVENPSLIPELIPPKTVYGLVDNLKDVQNFLILYMKASNDDMETKMETFDKYRAELLKYQNLDNSNFLQENVKYPVPRDEREFKVIKKQYDKMLSKVGLTIVPTEGYSKYHLEEDPRFTYKKFEKLVPSDVKEYLKLRAKHYEACICKDFLMIKPAKLAQRIGDYEMFVNSNPEFRYSDEVKDLLFSYTFIYAFNSDRTNIEFIRKKSFLKSDKKFLKKYPYSQLKELFSHLISSANGISENQFDKMYPYEYQKTLDALKPDKSDLGDIFTIVRKNIMQLKADANYQYIYVSESDSWVAYDASKPLKKGDVILALSDNGYDVYDYKYKKTNQTIKPDGDVKLFIKMGQLFAYFPARLQICSLDCMYGSYSFRTLSVKALKKLFPNTLIINIDTFGSNSVQIDKASGAVTYMLVSLSGVNYDGYSLSGNVSKGELPNIFTVSTDESTQVIWSDNSDGATYNMYFITQSAQNTSEEVPSANVE